MMKRLQTLCFLVLVISLAALLFPKNTTAQIPTNAPINRELGLRLSGLSDFDFIYKKELEPNRYRRYRLGFANLDFTTVGELQSYSLAAGVAIGAEKRRALTDELKFIYGSEWLANFSLAGQEGNMDVTLDGGLGVVLGFQADFFEKFAVSLEAIPTLLASYRIRDGDAPDLFQINGQFNVNSVAVCLVYKFAK